MLGDRGKRHIDGRTVPVDGGILIEANQIAGAASYEGHVVIARCNQRITGQHAVAVFGFFHGNPAQAVHPVCPSLRKPLRHVLGNENRRAIRRQHFQHLFHGFGSAGGRPDGHDGISRLDHRGGGVLCAANDAGRNLWGCHVRLPPNPSDSGRLDLFDEFLREFLHPETDVDLRFGHDIHRAQLQRAESRLAALLRQGTDHQHRHGRRRHEFLQKRQPIHVRHYNVQRDDVRTQRFDFLPGAGRIMRDAHDFDILILRQQMRQKLPDQGRVVDNQYANFLRHNSPCRHV